MDADQRQLRQMQHQLTEAKEELVDARHRQEVKDEELAAAKRDLQYSFEINRTRQSLFDDAFLEERKKSHAREAQRDAMRSFVHRTLQISLEPTELQRPRPGWLLLCNLIHLRVPRLYQVHQTAI